jgi:hypothetical protein
MTRPEKLSRNRKGGHVANLPSSARAERKRYGRAGRLCERNRRQVFDGTLRQGMAVQLEQSPYLELKLNWQDNIPSRSTQRSRAPGAMQDQWLAGRLTLAR